MDGESCLHSLLQDLPVQDYYAILGLTGNASLDDIREAYLKLARECHPDLHPEDVEGYTRRFQAVNEAYTILHDPMERERFDRRWAHFQSSPIAQAAPAVHKAEHWEGPGAKYRKARGGRSRYFSRPSGFFGMR